jgi:hypothetical protein
LGWFGSAGVEFVDHGFADAGEEGSDKFNLVNATVGYRFPNNVGVISIEAQNLLDNQFHYQNRTIRPDLTAAPRYAPDLTVFARATISF